MGRGRERWKGGVMVKGRVETNGEEGVGKGDICPAPSPEFLVTPLSQCLGDIGQRDAAIISYHAATNQDGDDDRLTRFARSRSQSRSVPFCAALNLSLISCACVVVPRNSLNRLTSHVSFMRICVGYLLNTLRRLNVVVRHHCPCAIFVKRRLSLETFL